ncbi:MAG: flippase-like domain-containing protein [Candidatus Aureabacteria bacterium]|nr:flippase-like domain-containing protein [Candidatus Auribacterota bacterium]
MERKIKILGKLLISIAFSLLILSLIFRLVNTADREINKSLLFQVIRSASFLLMTVYLFFTVLQAFLRAMRYRFFLECCSEENLPGSFDMFIVTVVRNMFVDLLPVRIGELSYVALLNKGYKVKGANALSSLAVSFFFDFITIAFLFFVIVLYQSLWGSMQIVMWRFLAGAVFFVFLAGIFLFYLLKKSAPVLLSLKKRTEVRIILRIIDFVLLFIDSVEKVKSKNIFGKALILSFFIRICKYTGFYFAFLAVTVSSFPKLALASIADVFLTLITAEGAAGIPVPSFMGFGPYEAGGMAVLTLLGFSASTSVLTMFAMHIYSQAFDYLAGLFALIIFLFRGNKNRLNTIKSSSLRYLKRSLIMIFLAVMMFLFIQEFMSFKKHGAFIPPPKGNEAACKKELRNDSDLSDINGFIVWSSNRYGNHDILMRKLSNGKISRLTEHPHTEYFPRISPDGKRIIFCRSQSPWVSQRDFFHWDVYMMDIDTKKEKFIARFANTPHWSEDGSKIYFQYKETMFAGYDVNTDKITVLFQSGKTPFSEGVQLVNPHFSSLTKSLAVTLRGKERAAAIATCKGGLIFVSNGCQLTWSLDGLYLYFVEKNAIHKYFPKEEKRELWFELSGDYSHVYFPKVDNTGNYLILGACAKGHEHDTADYEIFLWKIGTDMKKVIRMTFHTGNDNWPDIYINAK